MPLPHRRAIKSHLDHKCFPFRESGNVEIFYSNSIGGYPMKGNDLVAIKS